MKTKYYVGFGVVALISLGIIVFLPVGSFVQSIASIPLACALVAAVYQIIRDEAAHQKRMLQQKDQQLYSLSISSHMASTAFDRHVEFCESYRSAVLKGSKVLFGDGPAPSATGVSSDLHDVRVKYGLWITKEINEILIEFEKAIRRIGIKSRRIDSTRDNEKRLKIIEEVEDLYERITEAKEKNLEKDKIEEKRERGIEDILTELQNILGISELTALRRKIIKNANKGLQSTPLSRRD